MSPARVEPEETVESCFSNQGFRASTIGAECRFRAASRTSGSWRRTFASTAHGSGPRTGAECCDVAQRGLRDRRFGVAYELHEAAPQMAPAMHQRPRSLGPLHAGEPVIAVIAVALQEAPPDAVPEGLGMGAAAPRRISAEDDRAAGERETA